MMPLLDVRDLRVRYPLGGGVLSWIGGNQPAFVDVVHGVSLTIGRGETLAVVGESGSGKTTLAMALCGLAPILSGEVQMNGKSLPRDRDNRLQPDRKRVALMFQDPSGSLSPRMTVRRLLAEPFLIHPGRSDDPDRSALDLLSMVGLDPWFADRYPHQLSGGQARRVSVARALALTPDLLIADEPTAGLDVSIQGDVLNLLSDLQKQMGLGIMIITHNLNIVRHISNRMAIMYLGRFVEQGISEQVIRHPRHPYTSALLSANPSTDPEAGRRRVELRGETPGLIQRPTGCEFHTRCPRMQEDCRRSFPAFSGERDRHSWHCIHPLD
jgi:oligopeptide/dipeptide ABC transporter ATP-binding protein